MITINTPYLADLARGVHADIDAAAYVNLLDRVVADLKLTSDERHELAAIAAELGLDEHERDRAHREFLNGLIDAALEDSVVTDDEHEQLCRVAALLNLDVKLVARRTNPYRFTEDTIALAPGLLVCFTGAALDEYGNQIDRNSVLEVEAKAHGLIPINKFRKTCGLVVAADVASESAKVTEARRLGVPVASLNDYRAALKTGQPLAVTRMATAGVAQCRRPGLWRLLASQSLTPKPGRFCATVPPRITPGPQVFSVWSARWPGYQRLCDGEVGGRNSSSITFDELLKSRSGDKSAAPQLHRGNVPTLDPRVQKRTRTAQHRRRLVHGEQPPRLRAGHLLPLCDRSDIHRKRSRQTVYRVRFIHASSVSVGFRKPSPQSRHAEIWQFLMIEVTPQR